MGKQTDRINQMEAHLDTLIAANKQLISALETFKNAQDAYVALDEYYNSKPIQHQTACYSPIDSHCPQRH